MAKKIKLAGGGNINLAEGGGQVLAAEQTGQFGFWYPTQSGYSALWIPEYPPHQTEPETDRPEQLVGRRGDGSLVVQNKGAMRRRWTLEFSLMSLSDRNDLETFYKVVDKSFNAFEFDDGSGTLYTVRWMNAFHAPKDFPSTYEIVIELEEQL